MSFIDFWGHICELTHKNLTTPASDKQIEETKYQTDVDSGH
jgi:hypothetical protein